MNSFRTLNLGRHISLLEQTPAGHAVKEYFLHAEQEFRERRPELEELRRRLFRVEMERYEARRALALVASKHAPGSLTAGGAPRGLRRASAPVSGGRSADAFEYAGYTAVLARLGCRQLELPFAQKGGPV